MKRESEPKCRRSRDLWMSYFLGDFAAVCYYCYSNNSRTVRLISPAPEQRKIRRNFRRIFCTCCECYDGMGEHSFPKIFPDTACVLYQKNAPIKDDTVGDGSPTVQTFCFFHELQGSEFHKPRALQFVEKKQNVCTMGDPSPTVSSFIGAFF